MPAYRFALVELYTELPRDPYEDLGSATWDAILADPEGRERAVREVIHALRDVECRVVLFPGWTLVGCTVPGWVTDSTVGRTLVMEMLPEGGGGNDDWPSAFVVRNRQVLIGPVYQLFWDNTGAGKPGRPSQEAIDLTAQLRGESSPDRRWAEPIWPEAGLILCGEVNVIKTPRTQGDAHSLVNGLPSFDLVANPAHTPSSLPAMTWKRQYLSRMRPGAVLLTTANTHGRWVQLKKGKPRTGRSGYQAAEVFQDGQEMTADEIVEIGHHRIHLYA